MKEKWKEVQKMTNTLELRDKLINLISNASEVKAYHITAPKDESYPYSVFSFKRTISDTVEWYILTVDVWDSYETTSRVDTITDRIEKALDMQLIRSNSFYATIYKGNRQNVDDQDKQIKRAQIEFTLHIVERN